MPIGDDSTDQPAGQIGSGSLNQATHCVVPRNAPGKVALEVLTEALSIQSRNGGLYRPSRISGASHQKMPAAAVNAHHRLRLRLSGPGSRVNSHQIGNGSTAPTAIAFTPPQQAIARPDRAAARS